MFELKTGKVPIVKIKNVFENLLTFSTLFPSSAQKRQGLQNKPDVFE